MARIATGVASVLAMSDQIIDRTAQSVKPVLALMVFFSEMLQSRTGRIGIAKN